MIRFEAQTTGVGNDHYAMVFIMLHLQKAIWV